MCTPFLSVFATLPFNLLATPIDRFETIQRLIAIAENDRQQIVKVMGNTGGESANCFQLLSVEQLAFKVFAFAHIEDNGIETGEPSRVVEERLDFRQYPHN